MNMIIMVFMTLIMMSYFIISQLGRYYMYYRDSNAVVVLVGNSSIHLENASIRTRMNMLPCASGLKGHMWSKWITSNGM